jgi:hypothetical protein
MQTENYIMRGQGPGEGGEQHHECDTSNTLIILRTRRARRPAVPRTKLPALLRRDEVPSRVRTLPTSIDPDLVRTAVAEEEVQKLHRRHIGKDLRGRGSRLDWKGKKRSWRSKGSYGESTTGEGT